MVARSLLRRLFGSNNVAKMAGRGDLDGLERVVGSDGRTEDRVAALEALTELGADRAHAVLVESLACDSAELAEAAEGILRDLGADASEALCVGLGGPAADRALALLLAFGEGAVEPLQLACGNAAEEVRRRGLDGLAELDRGLGSEDVREARFRALLAAIGDRSPELRRTAAAELEELGDPRAGRALAAQLKDGDEAVREACRSALRSLGPPAALHVVDALSERNPKARRLAAGLVGELCGAGVDLELRREAVGALLEHVEDRDTEVREAVLHALGEAPVADVVAAALEELEDPEGTDLEGKAESLARLLEHVEVNQDLRRACGERIAFLSPDPAI